MRVVMPVAKTYSRAQKALKRACPDAEFVQLEDDYAYGNLVSELWYAREPFVIVEHDIVVRQFSLVDLWLCKEPWCGFPYLQVRNSNPVMGLGCTRFGPECFDAVPDIGTAGMPWQNVDPRVAVLRESGLVEHVHQPALDHLNPKVL